MAFDVRPLQEDDRGWAAQFLEEHWGATIVVSRGQVHRADRYPGFVALGDDQPVGLITYHIADGQCDIVAIDSLAEGIGIGSALIDAVQGVARRAGCHRLWLITTNDNLHALRFYQKRGFVLAALHRDAIVESRKLKPSIPLIGFHGIPIRDEIELEMPL